MDPVAIEHALTALRDARLALYVASRARNLALTQNKRATPLVDLNDAVAAARAAWLAARTAAAAALEAP